MTLAYILMGVAILGITGFIAFYTRTIQKKKQQLSDLNQAILEKNAAMNSLLNTLGRTEETIRANEQTIVEERFTIDGLATRKKELNNDIATQVENIEQITEEEFKKKYMAERKEWLDERQEEYLQMQNDFVDQFREENKKKLSAAQELTEELTQLKSSVDAAVEAAKRHAEEENFNQFHTLQMCEHALSDIKKLDETISTISPEAADAVAKVIWKVYYEKPYTDLVGRVVGSGRHTGIYRITNINSKKCYVGQAVDIASRWQQHIKRAINAEPRTQNKLYPAMYKEGVENFTFEIIEECEVSKLNEREDYWQDFYKAKEYGYSMR